MSLRIVLGLEEYPLNNGLKLRFSFYTAFRAVAGTEYPCFRQKHRRTLMSFELYIGVTYSFSYS